MVVGARAAVADLLGCDAGGVVFGRSMTQLTYDLAAGAGQAVGARRRGRGDPARPRREHPALGARRPQRAGATVRWVDFDRETGELTVRRRACCRSGPGWSRSPAPPTCSAPAPTSPAIAEAAHAVGRAAVRRRRAPDAARPGRRRASSGADFYACSPYKFFGPHLGVLVADPALLESVPPGQAAALHRRGAGALRARHAALRDARRRHRRGRLHRRARRPSAADRRARVLESMRARRELRGGAVRAAARRPRRASTACAATARPRRRTPTVLFAVEGRTGRGGARAPGRPRGERAGQQLLRARGLAADRASATPARCGPGSRRTPREDDVDRLLAGVAELAR